MNRTLYSLDDFIQNSHKLGYSLLDHYNAKVPCLYVENTLFEHILKISSGKKTTVDTNLNIYDDGVHVFVDIILKFLEANLEESFLLYANETLDFFKNLSESGMLGIAPEHGGSGSNVFFVQLPNREKAEKAYEMIKKKVKHV